MKPKLRERLDQLIGASEKGDRVAPLLGGDQVERLGGQGEPDLLVHHEDGKVTVVSCKCFFDTKTTSIPIKEFEPEISKSRELQAQGLLRRLVIDFNNIAKKARTLRALDPELHDSTITFR